MKYTIALLSLVFWCSAQNTYAQQNPQFTNFLFNSFAINPAIAGLQKCLDARVGYRNQWVGFENNPRTVFLTAHQRIKSISKERGVQHGAGLTVESDNTGPTGRTALHAAYAIHLPLSRKTRVSFGVSAGVLQYRVDMSQIFVPQVGDPILQQSENELVFPDIKFGIWLYNKSWFAGFSGGHLTNPTLDNIGVDTRLQPHFNLMAGRVYEGGEKLSFIPATQFKFTGNSKPSLDVQFWVDYDDAIALGAGFRSEDAAYGMLKFNFLDHFTVAYAYDFTYSRMRYGGSNSHEIILGIYSCSRKQRVGFVPCAAYD